MLHCGFLNCLVFFFFLHWYFKYSIAPITLKVVGECKDSAGRYNIWCLQDPTGGPPSQPPPSADNDLETQRWGNWLFKVCNSFYLGGPFTLFLLTTDFLLKYLTSPTTVTMWRFFKKKNLFSGNRAEKNLDHCILISHSLWTDLKMQFSRTERLGKTHSELRAVWRSRLN